LIYSTLHAKNDRQKTRDNFMPADFYNNNAQPFFDSTKDVDMSHVLSRFIAYLKPGAHILDAGCGSGRDSKTFIGIGPFKN
jgi:2-polyprenyl-3-methyl-5-hydroxy-6-metoxy-1,4-benzoquinol methylase